MKKLTEIEALALIEIIVPNVTCEKARKALERLKEKDVIEKRGIMIREMPMKPEKESSRGIVTQSWWYRCPVCHDPLDYKQSECGWCHQKIDWIGIR